MSWTQEKRARDGNILSVFVDELLGTAVEKMGKEGKTVVRETHLQAFLSIHA